jgi:hypothetical protein
LQNQGTIWNQNQNKEIASFILEHFKFGRQYPMKIMKLKYSWRVLPDDLEIISVVAEYDTGFYFFVFAGFRDEFRNC